LKRKLKRLLLTEREVIGEIKMQHCRVTIMLKNNVAIHGLKLEIGNLKLEYRN